MHTYSIILFLVLACPCTYRWSYINRPRATHTVTVQGALATPESKSSLFLLSAKAGRSRRQFVEMKVLLVNMAAVMALAAGLLLFPAVHAQTGLLAVTG